MRLDHDLQWMKLYIKRAVKTFPKLKCIKHVHCVKTTLDLNIAQPATAYAYGIRKMHIYLALYRDKPQKDYKFNRVELLEVLAHEFCHAFYEGHVPQEEFLLKESEILKVMIQGESLHET